MWRTVFLHLSTNRAIRRMVANSTLARRIATRFVAGETVDSAIRSAISLKRRRAAIELDYLGENVTDAAQAEAARDSYLDLLNRLHAARLDGQISLKLTQMGLDVEADLCIANVEAIATRASSLGSFLWMDMEGSDYTDSTLEAYERVRMSHPNVGVALQAYLYRTKADLRKVLSIGGTVRLCKGAYSEPASLAYPDKADVDQSYESLMEALLSSRRYQAIATHDPRMIGHAIKYAAQTGIGKDLFEFQMLYGVRRDLQDSLLADGYQVRVYVPFGEQWYPYFMRRLAERPANLFFLLGSLFREGGRPSTLRPREAAEEPPVETAVKEPAAKR